MSAPRKATVERRTRETEIACTVGLDGKGAAAVATPIGFFTHMLETLARHSLVDLELKVTGDLHVDQHHTVEDTGQVIGEAISKALAERRGISRYGAARYPMDEALAMAAIDLGGRPHLELHAPFTDRFVGELDVQLLPDFFDALCRGLGANLHIDLVRGRSDHHKVEAIFKAVARALRAAVAREPRLGDEVPSTKGTLV